jgi:hypothetical protein
MSLGFSKKRENLVAAVALDVAHEDTTPLVEKVDRVGDPAYDPARYAVGS